MSYRESDSRVVWLPDEDVFGEIIGPLGAFFTNIRYIKGGMEYEMLMESNEFILLEDINEYDDDD